MSPTLVMFPSDALIEVNVPAAAVVAPDISKSLPITTFSPLFVVVNFK